MFSVTSSNRIPRVFAPHTGSVHDELVMVLTRDVLVRDNLLYFACMFLLLTPLILRTKIIKCHSIKNGIVLHDMFTSVSQHDSL
jgi:hypothetical protein